MVTALSVKIKIINTAFFQSNGFETKEDCFKYYEEETNEEKMRVEAEIALLAGRCNYL